MTNRTVTALTVVGLALLAACSGSDNTSSASTIHTIDTATIDTAPIDTATITSADAPQTTPPGTNTAVDTAAPAVTDVITSPGPTSTTPPDPAGLLFAPIGSVPNPVNMTQRPGDDAFYIVSQDGFVFAMRDGVVDDTAVLDISDDITSGGEQGLLGLAFSTNGGHAYVDYTNDDGDTEITEYAVDAGGGFDPSSKRLLLQIDQPYPNHNGGQVRIGPDGYLYIGMGDGGSGGDPNREALSLSTLLGKILRIDPTPSGDAPYTVPSDNPFVDVGDARPEIWSVGLRNPWRYSFDRATNDLWIADVGQGEWEEIDVAWADEGAGRGANFGWSAFEGTHRFNEDQPTDGTVAPIHEYQHGPAGCSVSGGARYRGTTIPALYGWYVYGDYCSGEVRAFPVLDDHTAGDEVTLTDAIPSISEVAQDVDGELYVLSVGQGTMLTLRPAG